MTFDKLLKILEENTAKRSFSCLMVDMGFLQEDVDLIQEAICPCDVYEEEPGHGLEKEFHSTIKYGIHDYYRPDEVYKCLELSPIKIKFGKMSLFQNDKYDVLKFDLVSSQLHELNKIVTSKLDCTTTFPVYHPHATVAYLKPGTGKYYTRLKNELTGNSFEFSRLVFSNAYGEKVYWSI